MDFTIRGAFIASACLGFSISSFVVAAPTPQSAKSPARPAIAGAWQLNRDASDRPGQMSGQPADGARRGGGGGGGGRMGGRGRGGGMGGGMRGRAGGGARGGAEDRTRTMEIVRDAMMASPRLTIVQTDGGVSLTDADGRVLTLAVNGKKEKHVVGSETVEMKAKWDAGQLVIETDAGGGLKIVKTYSVASGESRQLQVLVKAEGSGRGGGRQVRHVYDPMEQQWR